MQGSSVDRIEKGNGQPCIFNAPVVLPIYRIGGEDFRDSPAPIRPREKAVLDFLSCCIKSGAITRTIWVVRIEHVAKAVLPFADNRALLDNTNRRLKLLPALLHTICGLRLLPCV